MDEPSRAGSSPSDDDRPPAATVDVIDAEGSLGPDGAGWIGDAARRVTERLGVPGEVRVRLVGDGEMSVSHERYAGEPGTTDVLTFDLSGDPSELDVDILVCVDEARRQAAGHGHAVEREALLYVVHGILHCLGHDDHDDEGFDRMHAAEDELLEAIGVGVTFHRPGGGS
jgi:probable rRNA maturation factor